jgi:NAD(P)-dependent dehydrogenase (short-subunit alcohol dehydrogenase family)
MDVSLEGKVALVTGTGPNIGSGIALMLSKYGAMVACNDLRLEAAQACVARIERNGGQAMAVTGDVSNEAQVKAYVQEVLERWGRIDMLINNASILGGRLLLDENLEDFNRAVNVSAAGNFLNTKYVAISMIERGIKGSIVSISSSSGWQGAPGYIAYSFHKGGVNNFVRAAAIELAPYGIRVNSYSPTSPDLDNPELIALRGGTRSLRARSSPEPQDKPAWWRPVGVSDYIANFPMGAASTSTDIGHLVAWVCSDYARLITGCDFTVDGGARAKYWAYTPPSENAGPLPLIPMDVTGMD